MTRFEAANIAVSALVLFLLGLAVVMGILEGL